MFTNTVLVIRSIKNMYAVDSYHTLIPVTRSPTTLPIIEGTMNIKPYSNVWALIAIIIPLPSGRPLFGVFLI